MVHIINPIFYKSALQFNHENSQKIQDICAPLQQCFRIKHFAYLRAFNDGRYIVLTNNHSFIKMVSGHDLHFRSKHFSKMPRSLFKKGLNKQIWPTNVRDECIEIANAHGIYNGYNVVREKKGTLEAYLFSTDKEHPLINDFYRDHFSLLEEFITYFHKLGHDLCDPSDTTKFGVSPHLKKTYPHIERIFEGTHLWEKEAGELKLLFDSRIQREIAEIAKANHLTPRELQCLLHLSDNKTIKEIGQTLNISPRTVETHIDKIRLKTACVTQNEIIRWVNRKFSPFLDEMKWVVNNR